MTVCVFCQSRYQVPAEMDWKGVVAVVALICIGIFVIAGIALFAGLSVDSGPEAPGRNQNGSGMVGPGDAACSHGNTCLPMQQCSDRHKAARSLDSMLVFPCSNASGYVCCPPIPRKGKTLKVDPARKGKTLTVDPEKNKRLLPIDDCGALDQNRISAGNEAELGQFPWMGLLAYKPDKTTGKIEYHCGATLISNQYVLTAAHCVSHEKLGPPVYVRLGEHDISKEKDCITDEYCAPPPVDAPIEKIIIHNLYNHSCMKNDIALLRLNNTVAQTLYTSPICLPFGLNVTGEEEKKYIVAGWGKIEGSSVNRSDVLLFTSVPSAPVSECDELQTEEVRPIDELQLCAGGSAGRDACKGDSGGPLMDVSLGNDGTSIAYQVGIVSFGNSRCGTEVPSVYTRVSSYLTWILANLQP